MAVAVPVLVHGLWDFSLISTLVVDPSNPASLVVLSNLDPILLVVVLIRRHHIEPDSARATDAPAVA